MRKARADVLSNWHFYQFHGERPYPTLGFPFKHLDTDMNQHQPPKISQSYMQATLDRNGYTREFKIEEVDTDVHFGKRSFFGIRYEQGSDSAYSFVLTLPEKSLVEGNSLSIGPGEEAENCAYFGSTEIGHSGWATGGNIVITKMDGTSGAFAATFHYTIESDMGQFEIVDGSLSMSLADHTRRNSFATGQVQAQLDPALFPSLGDLDAQTIEYKDLEDGRISLRATQQVEEASQGILMIFSEKYARLFFRIGNGIYDMFEGSLQYQWDRETRTLTGTFTDYVVSYKTDHRITGGSINVTLT